MRRIAIGLLIAPLWAPALMAVYAALLASPPDLLKDLDRGSWIGLAVILGTLLGYAAVLAIGLPAHLVLQRRNRRSVWAYLITWFAGAVAAWSIVFILSFARYELGFSFSYLAETIVHRPYVPLAIGLLGALMGASFWAVARPDREPLRSLKPL